MRKLLVAVSLGALLSVLAPTSVLADAVADCAKIQGKALAVLLDAVLKEGTRACAAGSGGAPQQVSRKTVGAIMGKYFAGVGAGIDKFGQGACGLDYFQVQAENILRSTVRLADQVCLVP
jgi:hypothetical protein